MKWEAVLAMILLIALGVWLVYMPRGSTGNIELRENARLVEFNIARTRGWIEVLPAENTDPTFRIIRREGTASNVLSATQLRTTLGDHIYTRITTPTDNHLFRLFNITTWTSMVWVGIGLLGQAIFSSRFLIQWIVSERKQESVIPEIFWWISLVGGISLFTYFVWRQDIVGVLGQSTGVIIYARNIRLLHKQHAKQVRVSSSSAISDTQNTH